ncbi:embryo defective [Parasponia andersonii]|uniref:Embryo defective n=1 Tax=Parasponia andersonii TaxID=3476 RepID=A0A2P5AIY3_PARAD|nr:embryo defective [Parasponia andersonii]
MEVLKPSAPTNLTTPFLTSNFTSEFPKRFRGKKSRVKYNIPGSIFYKNSSSSICLPLSNRRNYAVFSHFGRTTTRRNSLRKKLIEDQQVRHIPVRVDPGSDVQNPNPRFRDRDSLQARLSFDIVKESDSGNGVFEMEPKSKLVGESALFSKLENWVEQYKKDTEYWGFGSGQIFTVFMNSEGNVEWVSVHEDEILRRSRVEKGELGNSAAAKLKIMQAESLAREMESGENVIPRNSSVAKFCVQGEESSFFKAVQSLSFRSKLLKELPRVGTMVLYGLIAVWAMKKLFSYGEKEVKLTELEKEMMRRKIKSRKEREVLDIGGVEVVQPVEQPPLFTGEKPKLDKQELINVIARAKSQDGNLALLDPKSVTSAAKSMEFDDKIQEIRKMARQARETEGKGGKLIKKDRVETKIMSKESYKGTEEGIEYREEGTRLLNRHINGDSSNDTKFVYDEAFGRHGNITQSAESSDVRQIPSEDLKEKEIVERLEDNATSDEPCDSREVFVQVKPRVIRSVKEARDYLSGKGNNQEPTQESQFRAVPESAALFKRDQQYNIDTREELGIEEKVFTSIISDGTSNSSPLPNASQDSAVEDKEFVAVKNVNHKDCMEGEDDVLKQQISLDHEGNDRNSEKGQSVEEENWNEKNFNEHIVKKIGVSYRDNYMNAREKKNQQLNMNSSPMQLGSIGDESELEWMEDDSLAKIVFRVRENELAGRDPFYNMEAEDKNAFFKGLEKKVDRENEKLLKLHEYFHSNIENLDYGADGISLYDPPEKIIPHWKGPPLEKSPDFSDSLSELRKAIIVENIQYNVKKDEQNFLQKSTESLPVENIVTSSVVNDPKKRLNKDQKRSKTIIEGSDGSVKAGKKSGKEFWQHTKKWSRGFLESYNAATDPEVKSIMKDMGKDLDRWITEKEIQEADDLMKKLPERNKEFLEKKLTKLKREMELFGPQAVVSKYREYADDKEEDYLWWLDLPYVLCIELYTVEDGEQRTGFYSLEMATDLELEPKPHHVISFEDANDCKNLCYIIQAQMEMQGNGHAFVVAQPPKDAFREAKANGFNVTVIRKGELQLNVDQSLEEVEDQIVEIGSKMYHDMIMRERSVDISSVMNGVFGFKSKPTKRKRSKRTLKKRGKKLR